MFPYILLLSNSKLYQHLTIKLPYILVSTKLINKIRGLINVNIAQINYTIAQNNYTIAQNNYIIAQSNHTSAIAQNTNIIAQINNTIAQNNYTIAQKSYIIALNNYTIAQNNYTIAQNNYTIAQNNYTIAQSNYTNTIAQNNNTIAKNNNTIAQTNYAITEVEFSLVLTDTPEDTCTSFVYTLKCSNCNEYYVGRTHYGEHECYNKVTTNRTSAVYEHIKDTGHTFKPEDIQRRFSCCENNKLKILESLLIKRYIVRDIGFLNIFVMKELTLFQYDEDELEKAKRQLTKLTDRLGDARNNEPTIFEFSDSNDCKSVRNNDTQLTFYFKQNLKTFMT